jgi:hypothetical protein
MSGLGRVESGRALPGVVTLDVLAARRAQARIAVRIAPPLAEKAPEIVGHHLGSRPAEHERRAERSQDLGRGAHGRAEHRRAARERLDGDEPEALELARRQDEEICRLVVARQVGVRHEAEE